MRSLAMLLCGALLAFSQSTPDRAVLGVLQRATPGVKGTIVHRTVVTPELDLILAVAGAELRTHLDGPGFVWTESELLGLFLQDRNNANLVYTITLAPGIADCWARVERATVTDSVISCSAEKFSMHPSQKFIYDLRAKALVQRLAYQPFKFTRAFARQGGAVVVGTDGVKSLAVDFVAGRQPEFQILSEAAANSWLAKVTEEFQPVSFGAFFLIREEDADWGHKLIITDARDRYELPKSTFDAFAIARPNRVEDGYRRDFTVFDERIGPYQLFEGKLWFGKSFYDSEGHTGVGGFGYFDPLTARYVLFSAPAIQQLSTSALLVETDAVWMAMVDRWEYGNTSGGVVRFDRASQTYRHFETPGEISQIIRVGDTLLLPNHLGIDTIDASALKRYFVDKTTDGRLRIALAEK